MKRCLFLFVLMLLLWCAVAALAQSSTPLTMPPVPEGRCNANHRAALLDVMAQWREGYNAGRSVDVAALYEEDATYLTQHFITGIVHGRRAIQAYVQRGVEAHYHIDSLRALSVNCDANFAYLIARYDATNAGEKAFGVNLVVLRRHGKVWRIAAHESAVPDPAQAVQGLFLPMN